MNLQIPNPIKQKVIEKDSLMMHSYPLLTVENLTTHLPTKDGVVTPVKNVNFKIYPGQTLALLGESGSGKSLTAHSILQLLPWGTTHAPESQIMLLDRNVLALPEIELRKIRGKDVAMIFQEPMTSLNPVLRVDEQIEEVFSLHRHFQRKAYQDEVTKLLDAVQIQNSKRVQRCFPHELSGGMRQRVMIAMALAGNPKLLIADEPTTALDVVTQAQILNLLKKLQVEFGMSLLFITHDLKIAAKISDNIVVMKQGTVVEQGQTQDILHHPKHAYTKHLFSVAPKSIPDNIDAEAENVLSVQNLSVYFPVHRGFFKKTTEVVRAVDDVSLVIKSGETLGLVGESGSGKTTLAKAVLALIKPTAGQISLLNTPLNTLSDSKLRKKRNEFQIIFQDPFSSMDPRMRVIDILQEGMLALDIGSDPEERIERIDVLMQQVGLDSNWKYRYPHQFSGGERQRLCIARALSVSPRLIVCDEPTSSLDASVGAEVIDLLIELQKEYELSYLFITHNISLIKAMAHNMMVMYDGKIVESGKTSEVLKSPKHPYTQKLLECII